MCIIFFIINRRALYNRESLSRRVLVELFLYFHPEHKLFEQGLVEDVVCSAALFCNHEIVGGTTEYGLDLVVEGAGPEFIARVGEFYRIEKHARVGIVDWGTVGARPAAGAGFDDFFARFGAGFVIGVFAFGEERDPTADVGVVGLF